MPLGWGKKEKIKPVAMGKKKASKEGVAERKVGGDST